LPRAEKASEALNAICLTFDLTGHGRSGGKLEQVSTRVHVSDAVHAYDKLAGHPRVDPQRIGVCGASYGAYLAVWLTAHRPIRRLLLRAPGLYDDGMLDRGVDDVVSNPDAKAEALFTALNKSKAEVLILESGKDEVVRHEVIETYLRGCVGAQYALLPEATHGLSRPEWDRQFVAIIITWFRELHERPT
jgi:dipeptidyl aminopeptidase/acylaminoacyl peptidase